MEIRAQELPVGNGGYTLFPETAGNYTVGESLADFLLSGICSQIGLIGEDAEEVKARNPKIPEEFPAGWLKSFRGNFAPDSLIHGGLVTINGTSAKLTDKAIAMFEGAKKYTTKNKKHHHNKKI